MRLFAILILILALAAPALAAEDSALVDALKEKWTMEALNSIRQGREILQLKEMLIRRGAHIEQLKAELAKAEKGKKDE